MYIRDDLMVTVVAELATAKCQHALEINPLLKKEDFT